MKKSQQTLATELIKRANRRSWWADGVEVLPWVAASTAVALMIASGGLLALEPLDYVYSLGRAAGLVAAVLILTQVMLISRTPWIERVLGHDRATLTHTRLGKIAFILMLVHAGLITIMSAYYSGVSVLEQSLTFNQYGWFMLTAQLGLGVFALVVATSLYLVRSRWRYENWHAVHLFVYIAIALVVPHQFMQGSTFSGGGFAWWFWFTLYAIAFGSLIAFRLVRPVANLFRYDLRVAEVIPNGDGSTTVVMSGKNLDRMRARPGQFFLWRFLHKDWGRESHPFSLSRVATDDTLRITVKGSGDYTKRFGDLPVGIRVLADGPLGVFTEVARTKPGVVLVAAGIGITPLRALLEAHTDADGPCTLVYRVRALDEAPLLDEVTVLAAERGVDLHVMKGGRGDGWAPPGYASSLRDVVPDVAERDVYICGPESWAQTVEEDAVASGCTPASVHREKFAW